MLQKMSFVFFCRFLRGDFALLLQPTFCRNKTIEVYYYPNLSLNIIIKLRL